MFTKYLKRCFGLAASIGLALVTVSACSPPKFPLQITDISVHPDPVIGQTATLHVEVVSTKDEPDAVIIIDLPPGVKLMKGDLLWEGSLTANQTQSHEISICVLYEGDWRIEVTTTSILSEDSSYSDIDTVHLIVLGDAAKVVPGGEYRYTQPTGGVLPSTPLPEAPPSICAENT